MTRSKREGLQIRLKKRKVVQSVDSVVCSMSEEKGRDNVRQKKKQEKVTHS